MTITCTFLISEFEVVNDSASAFWTALFKKYFLELTQRSDESRDDMLFYIRKTHDIKNKSFKYKVSLFHIYIVLRQLG